jgi:hypothetical protein
MMQLDDFKIPGKQLVVRGSVEIRTEDIAGETSGTDLVEKGIKPKVLRVSLIIPFKDQQGLRDLIRVAESKNDKGEQTIYTITERTANAAGVRQVRFVETLTWDESYTLQVWEVKFALQEYMSNPERVEKRRDTTTTPSSVTRYQQVVDKAAGL